jgi:prepilin-type N-terminal cleavage/methylation domain-containing protein
MKSQDCHRAGFTLVEMMFSLTLGTLILLLAAGLLGSSGAGYGRTIGGVATGREGRAVLDQLGADFASAVMINGSSLDFGLTRSIAFITLLPPAAQSDEGCIGDACAVFYRLKDLETGGRTRRCLVRSVRESGETFAALRAGKIGTLSTGKFLIEEPLAFDVVGFEARPKSATGSGVWRDWVDDETGPPDVLEITLVLVRPELAGRTCTTAAWDALGESIGTARNAGLETLTATLRFGNHARR